MHPLDRQNEASPARPRSARALATLSALLDVRAALAIGALCSVGLGAGLAAALPSDPADYMPVDAVKPGMKGYGLTVFSGTEPEKFDVEIISTLRNFRPNQDLILIKTPHPRLDIAHTVAGMSGSPIFLNGKVIGAYAYGFPFGSEAIAGVTPIKSMLDELARPMPKSLAPAGGAPLPASASLEPRIAPNSGRHARAFVGATDHYDLASHAKQVAARTAPALAVPDGVSLARASTPIMLGGMTPVAMKLADDLLAPLGFEPLQGGGGGKANDPSAPKSFVDGGAIGVQLLSGDISAMGTGTVTRVYGDKLVAFGHPMLGGGIESLPTAIARVHWIMASVARSFKISEPARSLGALVNDRQAAIVVDSTAKAPTFPIQVQFEGVDGAPHPTWNMVVAHDRYMAPSFTAMALGSAAETTTAELRDMTWRAESRLKIARYGTITINDFGSGDGNPIGPEDFVRGRLVRAIGALLNNPWEDVVVESVDTKMRVSFEREVALLRSTKVLDPKIDAGEKARIRLDLQPRMGKRESKVIEVAIPAELAGREVEIELTPGYEVEHPQPTPNSVAELISVLQKQYFDSETMIATIKLRENGAAFAGKVASRLPPGASDTLRPSSQSDGPEAFLAQYQVVIPMNRFIVGRDTVRVEVRTVLR